MSAPSPIPGNYPIGTAGRVRQWDGHLWTDRTAVAPGAAAAPPWHHHVVGFLGHRWFQLAASGFVLGLLFAVLGHSTGIAAFNWLAGIGSLTVGVGFVMIAWQHLHLDEVITVKELVTWAALGGIVAFAVSLGLEYATFRLTKVGNSSWVGMLSSGPAEEFAKILVPVILYFAGRYRDPRAGFAIALGAGAAMGVIEGVYYTGMAADTTANGRDQPAFTTEYATLIMAAQRPLVELLHPITVGFVAAVAWRWAWVRGKFFTAPAVWAFVLVAVLHSFNDAVTKAAPAAQLVVGPAVIIGLYYLAYRRNARELVPPDAVFANPPRWRPAVPTN